MSTLPRATKSTLTPAGVSFFESRPVSDFDTGFNSSTAWTQANPSTSLSDDELEVEDDEETGQAARALYHFEGKAEFRELTVEAGDELEVLREEVGDGWSLVRAGKNGEVGLLPQTYYTFTSDFMTSPTLEIPPFERRREPSAQSITPRGSPKGEKQALPIIPQHTGEWFPSFRQSLLGGKSLNRFSTFVTSGAEEWVLKGCNSEPALPPRSVEDGTLDEEDNESNRLSRVGMGDADQHFVDVGPAWKTKVPPFRVLVHSPSKRTSSLSGAYTLYSVTSLFHPTSEHGTGEDASPPGSPMRITVHRRFSHFVVLHTALTRRLPGIALPPLPEKQYAGRFSDEFVEARRGDLERYICRIARHPVARYAEVLTFFLGCESDLEWKRQLPYHLSLPPAGPAFYAHVFHPDFNLDAEDAADAVERFDVHTRGVGKGVQTLRNIFGQVREARLEMSKAERMLSYALLSLITSKPLASAPTTGISELDEEEGNFKVKGMLNDEGAWCWRDGCRDCLKLTKAMQKTSETLQNVADLYDDHARRTQLATHEALKSVAHPSSMYSGIVETHRSALSRYNAAVAQPSPDEEVAARCETVLNTTMAEMETYHAQKVEDFRTIATEHLDGEIAFYEQILGRLRAARRAYDPPQYDQGGDSPRQPSMYERELENPRLTVKPLSQPCPHVYDSAPMRPVSAAIQEGVGMIFRGSTLGRSSVFGKFW
ncbi:PX-domain-containing protein [Gloeophyllum trabeum ATCC 11539]|uniref:PX-domain-containing protein n=1 Tax=Gloeophyllum trabeum (strain ATCC 11539 / FP-39264 / Madison 617) TaxID=670483 RepID=S7RI30_GLOTA|nr:PX-domain-containing protein [Gloeophyllum trabeum ATCC 11539]EPQ52264.1 PX-domain-containing protein [Gloeophyllum trabeum ATCC 11539]